VILTIVVLAIVCAIARFLFIRYTGNAVAANAAALAILAAFVIGSLAHPFRFPAAATSVAIAPTDAPPAQADATSAPDSAVPTQDATKLQDVTSRCRAAGAAKKYDGVGAIDVFQADGQPAIRATDGVQLDRSHRYDLDGWAAARDSKSPARAACLVVDGHPLAKVADLYGVMRADVANALGSPALGQSGFRIEIPQAALAPGAHTLRVAVLEADGSFAFIGPRPIAITSQ
jgi:hypothetical protein